MTLVKDGLIDQEKVSKPTNKGIRVISEMPTSRIIWYVADRHSAGLKTFTIVLLAGYIVYDKVGRWFL